MCQRKIESMDAPFADELHKLYVLFDCVCRYSFASAPAYSSIYMGTALCVGGSVVGDSDSLNDAGR